MVMLVAPLNPVSANEERPRTTRGLKSLLREGGCVRASGPARLPHASFWRYTDGYRDAEQAARRSVPRKVLIESTVFKQIRPIGAYIRNLKKLDAISFGIRRIDNEQPRPHLDLRIAAQQFHAIFF